MTPREIAAALDANPIAGLTHGLNGGARNPYLALCADRAVVCLYDNADDMSGVVGIAGRMKAKEFYVTKTTLRADLIEILAWSLCACQPDPAAPETFAALRTPVLYAEVLREFFTNQRPALAVFGDRYATIIAAIDAALETS